VIVNYWDRDDDDDDNIRLWMGDVISYSVVGARDDGGKRDGRYVERRMRKRL
jgi:hypothetical protein